MRDPLAGLPEQARERAVAAEQPSWTNPMLATLTDRRFSEGELAAELRAFLDRGAAEAADAARAREALGLLGG